MFLALLAAQDETALADFERRVGTEATLEKQKQQDDSRPPRPTSADLQSAEGGGFVDFEWLEMQPRVGMAIFSKTFWINASPSFGVEFRAPLPWLSPSSNPTGDYFGIWAELDGIIAKRTILPAVAQPSGIILMLTLGVDYTIIRDETWLVLVRAGMQFASYGGITDLHSGFAPVAGVTLGLAVSRSLSITLAPEMIFGKSDSIILGMVGLAIQF
jgi:hypothetical protein